MTIPTRRALFAGALAAAALPAAAASREPSSLADLLRQVVDAHDAYDKAANEEDDAMERWERPQMPEALRHQGMKDIIRGLPAQGHFRERGGLASWYDDVDIPRLSDALLPPPCMEGADPAIIVRAARQSRERVQEILGAYEDWQTAIEDTRNRAGVPAAASAANEAFERFASLRDQLEVAPAKNLSDLIIKARLALFLCPEHQLPTDDLDPEEYVAFAIVRDLLNLEGSA